MGGQREGDRAAAHRRGQAVGRTAAVQCGDGSAHPGGAQAMSVPRRAPRNAQLATPIALLLALPPPPETTPPKPQLPGTVDIAQHLDAQLPLDVMLRDETGSVVRLGDFFHHGRPVLLNFVYYNCPMLCPMVLEGMTSTLTELKFDVGKEYHVVTISIDPPDTPEQAAEKKEKYVKRYGRFGAANGWHFLTAPE